MRFTQLGALVATASISQAFLIPPEISAADTDLIKTLPFEDAITADRRVITINCPGCPVFTNIEGKTHVTQVDSILQLNFSITHDGSDRLILNGQPLYPVDLRATAFLEPLTASQMIKNSDNNWEYASTPTLGYSVSVHHGARTRIFDQDQIHSVYIHLEIMEVANKFLNGIPRVEIKLVETPTGEFWIYEARTITPKSSAVKATNNEQECTTLICKWRAIITYRLSQLRNGCGSKTTTPHPEESKEHIHPDHPGHKRPHGPRPHGAHRQWRHHRHGGFSRLLRGIVLHVFIPILVGIVVGITASLVGMVVGHIAIFTWRLFFRRNSVKYTKIQQEENTANDEQAKGLLEPQGPPPQYEEIVVTEKEAE